MSFSIANRMMIVNCSISIWEGRRLDRAVTRKTIEDNNVQAEDGLRVNKLLISRESMKDVITATNDIRTFVRERTVPWKSNGDCGLMRQMFPSFMEGFHEREQKWADCVNLFVTTIYPQERAKASFRLGDAYNADDYPHPEDLRSRFKVTLDMDAVSEAEDFRVKLDDDTVRDIQEKMRVAMETRVHNVMKDVWERVASMVERYVERTSPDIQRFHDTTVTNLQELVGLLPGLNLIGDPNLKSMAKRLNDTLCGYDPKDLRKDHDVRAAARKEAEDILNDMKGFMSAFGA